MPPSNEAAQYLPGLARVFFDIGVGVWLLIGAVVVALCLVCIAAYLSRGRKVTTRSLLDAITPLLVLGLDFCLLLSAIFGAWLLALQFYLWAKTGIWNGLPVATAFQMAGYDLSSIYYPVDWKGLAIVASWLLGFPISFLVPLAAFIAYCSARFGSSTALIVVCCVTSSFVLLAPIGTPVYRLNADLPDATRMIGAADMATLLRLAPMYTKLNPSLQKALDARMEQLHSWSIQQRRIRIINSQIRAANGH